MSRPVVIFNFQQISSIEDFYRQFELQFSLPDWFGKNLDALWDSVSAGIELPVTIVFTHLSDEQKSTFDDIIAMMHDAHDLWGDDLIFVCENDDEQSGCEKQI
ncbi:barstar family protein [Providencia vermicola]|uniref:Barstar family protein n=2 Tax=Providencia TaxID=586 RepID=A0AAI9MWU9_PROST|nr:MULTISPECIES: barstar family protein [Providencia]ELR5043701.1 barstar family protein [Providencia rettgeri]ELR5037178.1 barstar family protein [Providencia stuartii]ELR5121155.1 barstar family protein [Providencia stuartii]ELR5142217.1 barstar family protein [Providencia stuartii]ELR5291440.1 barstar family protein [Providencia stuartii]